MGHQPSLKLARPRFDQGIAEEDDAVPNGGGGVGGASTTLDATMTPPTRLFGRDPRDAQLFERLDLGGDGEGGGGALLRPPLTIRPGDKLRVTCAYDTTSRAAPTPAGWGHGDEMGIRHPRA